MNKSRIMIISLSLLLILIGLSCVHQSLRNHERQPSSFYDPDEQTFDRVNLDIVRGILTRVRPTKVEDFLRELQRVDPDYLSRHTFVYDSKSIQDASYQYPRVIVFGHTARILMAFNGHPTQQGYNSIEMIPFDDRTKEFHFFHLSFQGDTPAGQWNHQLPYHFEEDPPAQNGISCTQCHSSAPIWETYFVWPRAYGSIDDFVWANGHETVHGREIVQYPTDKENVAFQKFMATNRHLGRYNILPPQAAYDRGAMNPPRPNTMFTAAVSRLNFQRMARVIAKKMKRDPELGRFRYAIVGLVSCGYDPNGLKNGNGLSYVEANSIQKYIPSQALSSKFHETEMKQFHYQYAKAEETLKSLDIGTDRLTAIESYRGYEPSTMPNFYSRLISWLKANGVSIDDPIAHYAITDVMRTYSSVLFGALRAILEPRGIDTKYWPMTFLPGSYSFGDGEGGFVFEQAGPYFETELLKSGEDDDLLSLIHKMNGLAQDYQSDEFKIYRGQYCELLQSKNLRLFDGQKSR